MTEIKYLLDENVNPRLRKVLEQTQPETTVWAIGDPGAPGRGTLDPEILVWCEANAFVLITNNRASMPVHLQEHGSAGGQMPGIFILNPSLTMRETCDELVLIHSASEPKEYVNRIVYLPISF